MKKSFEKKLSGKKWLMGQKSIYGAFKLYKTSSDP
jgi:hypothetical protein